jgi:hypothetical protein
VLRRNRELDDFMGCDSAYCACHHSSLSSAFLCFGHCKIVTIGARTAQPQIRNKGIVPHLIYQIAVQLELIFHAAAP